MNWKLFRVNVEIEPNFNDFRSIQLSTGNQLQMQSNVQWIQSNQMKPLFQM